LRGIVISQHLSIIGKTTMRIDTFASFEDVMRWVDPWTERIWEEPWEADDSRILVSRSKKLPAGK